MSLTLWHRQFRNPIFLMLWTCYSEVQLVTSAAVSLLGALRAAWTFASSYTYTFVIGQLRTQVFDQDTATGLSLALWVRRCLPLMLLLLMTSTPWLPPIGVLVVYFTNPAAHRCPVQNLHAVISWLLGHISLRAGVNFFQNQWKLSFLSWI